MKLLLFDIDGTLLRGQGRGQLALTEAMQAATAAAGFSVQVTPAAAAPDAPRLSPKNIAGKTDLQYVYENLAPLIGDEHVAPLLPAIFAEHTARLRRYFRIEDGVVLLPGVREILAAVRERYESAAQCLPAVLTGNIQAGAQIKLGLFGLESFFLFGAFGDEGRVRRALPPVAVQKARKFSGRDFVGHDIVIIGDTPNDIDCGRPLGARTIALTTGPYSRAELESHAPDFILDSLTNTEQVLDAIFRD